MRRIATLAALGAAALLGCGRSAPSAESRPPERRLATAAVDERETAGMVEVDGTVVGASEAILSSRLAAAIAEVSAIPGRTVAAGTVLVRLADRESGAAVESARAALSAAQAALSIASRNRARYERLEGRGAAAAVELDRARQEEASASAAAASASAALARAETDRAQSVLVAPFDAVVVEKMVSAGDLAAPGRPLVRLASARGRRVEAAPGEDEAASLAVGDAVSVRIGGADVSGRVGEIVGAVDPATRRRIVRVDLPPDVEPPVGRFARVRLPGVRERRIVAPESAVVSRGGLRIAWAVDRAGRVSPRYVQTGATLGGGLVEVRSGLEPGERVVVDPPADLIAGTRVAS
jgi:RND family efflux transporter MFP subunit